MRDEVAYVKVPVENEPLSVVVEVVMTERSVEVPYAKPRKVTADPPILVMFPFRVAPVSVMLEGAKVLATGGVTTAKLAVTDMFAWTFVSVRGLAVEASDQLVK